MAISALPETDSRAIASSQVITDPVSVVRELVANALDAGASSISVEISTNALDVIQVRDNGHGIPADDRSLVGIRHCTSKIRSLDDLSSLGGKSLGFRGEALASVFEMSDDVIVSTRYSSDKVGAKFSIRENQSTPRRSANPEDSTNVLSVNGRKNISLPVGTTLLVLSLLSTHPVRRRTALKTSAKTLERIKSLLQGHAIARPAVRLSLKVLKSEGNRANWVYASKPDATLADAASIIFGPLMLKLCEFQTWDSTNQTIRGRALSREDRFVFKALLPSRSCDVTANNGIGQFISIDSRPVASSRGTFKKLVGIFKRYLRNSRDADSIANPFLCMDITCPISVYDVNVEPAKDDVLFADEEAFLSICEHFFDSFYRDARPGTSVTHEDYAQTNAGQILMDDTIVPGLPRRVERDISPSLQSSPFQTLGSGHLEQREVPSLNDPTCARSPIRSHGLQEAPNIYLPQRTENLNWRTCMYTGTDDTLSDDQDHALEELVEPDFPDPISSNPWTIAKMNNTLKPGRTPARPAALADRAARNHQLLTPHRESRISLPNYHSPSSPIQAQEERAQQHNAYLPSPIPTSPLSKYSLASHKPRQKCPKRPMDQWLGTSGASSERELGAVSVNDTPLEEIRDASLMQRPQRAQAAHSTAVSKPFKLPTLRPPAPGNRPSLSMSQDLPNLEDARADSSVFPGPGNMENADEDGLENAADAFQGEGEAPIVPHLVMKCDYGLTAIEKMTKSLQGYDTYIRGSGLIFGFARPDLGNWRNKLMSLRLPGPLEDELDLQGALRDYLAIFG